MGTRRTFSREFKIEAVKRRPELGDDGWKLRY